MKRILFGNFRLGYEYENNVAHCEILDMKTQAKYPFEIKEGKAYFHNTKDKPSKQETFMKAIKRLYDMYDKEVA